MTRSENIGGFQRNNIFRVHGLLLDEVVESAKIFTDVDLDGDMYRLLLSTKAFQVFANAAQSCHACSTQEGGCAHLQYAPKNGFSSSAFRSALLRTLVSDWVDPTRSYKEIIATTSNQDLNNIELIVRDLAENYEVLISMKLLNEDKPDDSNLTDAIKVAISEKIFKGLNGRIALRTKLGWIGTGPLYMKVGDHIVAVHGGDVPYVLRHVGGPTEGKFRLIGGCYVDGIMFGELTKNPLARKDGDMTKPIELSAFDLC
jgi:hypothetical protein